MKIYVKLCFGIVLLCSACISNDKHMQATDRPQESVPIPMYIPHEAFEITDSLAIIRLEGDVKLYFVEKGDGPTAKPNDLVEVHYQGMLEDGKVFDSSYDRAQTTELRMGTIIEGLKIALREVPKGSKVKVMVPAALAYGASPPDSTLIPPNADLNFDVEVIDIK